MIGSGSGARRRTQRGIGLIEILVSIVILSIGFLAAARMQVQGMRSSQNAYLRAQANFLATEMIDRMRSNVDGVVAGSYDGMQTRAGAIDPGCDRRFCDSAEIAAQDLHDWSAWLHDQRGLAGFVPLLPGSSEFPATGSITRLDEGLYAVKMTWKDSVDGDAEAGELLIHFATEIPG